jgi:hypothetical protein
MDPEDLCHFLRPEEVGDGKLLPPVIGLSLDRLAGH